MNKVTAIIFAICMLTGAVVTWPFRDRLYSHYHGSEGAGVACAFYGLVTWIVVLGVITMIWLVR